MKSLFCPVSFLSLLLWFFPPMPSLLLFTHGFSSNSLDFRDLHQAGSVNFVGSTSLGVLVGSGDHILVRKAKEF